VLLGDVRHFAVAFPIRIVATRWQRLTCTTLYATKHYRAAQRRSSLMRPTVLRRRLCDGRSVYIRTAKDLAWLARYASSSAYHRSISPRYNQLLDCNMVTSAGQHVYTISNGRPVSYATASQRVGPNGPILLQDFHLIELLAHFDRERIPERVVRAKGAGAFGEFEVTQEHYGYRRSTSGLRHFRR
jgi:hypothetical protein